MKSKSLISAALLALSVHVCAVEAVKIDLYADGDLKYAASLAGANSSIKISHSDIPNTTIELRLIAPEPLIVEVKETTGNGESESATGRVKLLTPGSSMPLANIQGGKFHSRYVLVRNN